MSVENMNRQTDRDWWENRRTDISRMCILHVASTQVGGGNYHFHHVLIPRCLFYHLNIRYIRMCLNN